MANEFKVKNGLIVVGDTAISGAATVGGNSVIHTGNIGSYAVTSLNDTLHSVTGRGATTTNAIGTGNLTINSSSSAASYIYLLSSTTGESELRMGDTDTDAGSIAYNNNLDRMAFRTNAAERVYIDSSGNVGIGVSSPAQRLDVLGKMKITGDIILAQINGRIDYDNGNGGGALRFWSTSAASERMRITSSGNVGIGTTSPVQKLQVDGSIYSNGGEIFVNGNKGLTAVGNLIFKAHNGSNYFEGMRLTSSGNVLIGTTTDSGNRLQVEQSGSTAGISVKNGSNPQMMATNGTSKAKLQVISASGVGLVGTETNNSFGIYTNNIERATFDTAGNVGIGTTAPAASAKLTVMGNQTFGLPGNGSNVNGRFMSIEGNTDVGGEGSSRIFFAEHNSSTAAMDNYGLSIGYRGGDTTILTAAGNSWTGLADIGNGMWGMWGHDGTLNGSLIMSGDRAATYVNFSGNNITGVDDLSIADQIIHTGDTDTYMQFHAADEWRVVTGGVERLEVINARTTVQNVLVANDFVGIGTTSPSYRFHLIDNTNSAWSTKLQSDTVGTFISHDSGYGMALRSTSSSSSIYLMNLIYGGTDTDSGGTSAFFVRADGNVGIGTSSPADPLHIATSGNDKFVRIENSNAYTGLWLNDSGTNNGWLVLSGYTNTTSPGDFAIREYGVQTPLTIKQTTGNVGIGTTVPGAKTHISGGGFDVYLDYSTTNAAIGISSLKKTDGKSAIVVGRSHSTNNSAVMRFDYVGDNNAANYLGLGFYANDDLMVIKPSGNVGIGTSSPSTKLDVNGVITATGGNSTNWNSAYSWGDHSSQGYLTSASLSGYATQTYVNNAVSALVDSAPGTLDTLNELAAALGDDPNFATTVATSIGTKWTQDNTKISNWDTAYSWGNHASAGYITEANADVKYQDATARKKWYSIAASGTQAKRYRIARVYYCPKHWDDTWQNIEFELLEESYNSGYVRYNLFGYYNGTENQTLNLKVVDFRGLSSDINKYNLYLGSHTAAGWLHSGQNVYYTDIYVDVSYYKDLKITADTFGHSYQNTDPTAGAAITVFYDNPDVTNITYTNVTKQNTYVGDGSMIWNSSNFTSTNISNWDTAYSWGNHAGLYDNYGSWNLKTNGTQRTTVQSGGTLDIVAGTNVSVSYGAGGVVTINSTDTNTTYTAGTGLTLSGTQFSVTSGTYAAASHTHSATDITSGTLASARLSGTYSIDISGKSATSDTMLREDNRTISPSELSAGYMKFGFTSWANNNTSPYADFLHLRSYTDSSGGSDNLVMFKKSGIGMRIYQQSWGSTTAYSTYEDVWTTGSFTSTNVSNWNTAYGWGNHASAGYLTSVTAHTHSASDITSGTLSGDRLTWNSNDGFTGTYSIVWRATNDLYTASWLQVRGSDDALLTRNIIADGTITATGGNSTNWNTAYSWGNHASAGYLTSSSLSGYATQTYVNNAVSALVDSAPGTLDTLNELAAALGDDPNFATTVTNSIAGKVAKSGDTMTGDLVIGTAAAASTTNTFDTFTQLVFDNSYNDAPRGPNKIQVHNNGTSWAAGIGVHDGTVAYYTGSTHKWYRSSSQTSFTELMNLSATGVLYLPAGNSGQWNTAYSWGDHGTAGYALTTDLANYMPTSGGTFSGPVIINGSLTVNGTITESSSIKIKENVEDLNGSLEKVVNLRPVSYNKIGQTEKELGLIAEEVQTVYPEFVQFDENGEPVGVNYSRLTVALIGAVQELTKQVEELKNKING